MKLTETSALQQAQLAVAVAQLLTANLTVAEIDVLIHVINAVRDNVTLFKNEKKSD